MFIFKKLFSQFFFPLPLIEILLVLGLILLWRMRGRKPAQFCLGMAAVLLIFFSSHLGSNLILRPIERSIPYPALLNQESVSPTAGSGKDTIAYIVVLGGGHVSDTELPLTSQISEGTLVRLVEGIRLYRKLPGSRLILSGGAVFDPVSDASVMASLARELGVPDEDIIQEDKSRDTFENAAYVEAWVKKSPFYLVTSASHMKRSAALFEKMGMRPLPVPTRHLVRDHPNPSPGAYFPDPYNLYKSRRAVYELMGMIWAEITRKT